MYVNANNARDSSLLVSKILVKFNWDHPQEGCRMQMIFPVKFFQVTDYSLFTVSRAGTASVTVCLGFSHSGTPTPFSLTPSQRTAACLLQYLSLCLASYVRWQRGTIRIRLPQAAHAASRAIVRHAAIDRYLLLAGPTAANLQQRVWCCGCCWLPRVVCEHCQ